MSEVNRLRQELYRAVAEEKRMSETTESEIRRIWSHINELDRRIKDLDPRRLPSGMWVDSLSARWKSLLYDVFDWLNWKLPPRVVDCIFCRGTGSSPTNMGSLGYHEECLRCCGMGRLDAKRIPQSVYAFFGLAWKQRKGFPPA